MLALRGVAAAFLVAFAALLPLPLQAEAQSVVLVSNLGQNNGGGGGIYVLDQAQAFTTGDNTGGYTLTSVDIHIYGATGFDNLTVSINSDSSGSPGASLGTLTNPGSVASDDIQAFTASGSGITLAKETTYFIVLDATDGANGTVRNTASDNEDASPAANWSIGDASLYRNLGESGAWTSWHESKEIRVNGTVGGTTPTLSDDATLSDLELENNSGTTITLSPTFASGTTTYTAMVVNAVDEITIIPTVNESNATYEIQDSGGTALTDADSGEDDFQVDLSEGENEIQVEVTAQDTTTLTYTVTVTRSRRTTTTPAAPPEVTVPNDWSLIPAGVGAGGKFRLIFLSSTKSNATSYDIADYNTFIQGRAAAGHTDIQTYSSGFRAVGCTADSDARDNTATTGTGVVIHWLNGNKVADNYGDFKDGSWDEEAADKNELGANGPNTNSVANYPFTGCQHNGTESFSSGNSRALGAPGGDVGVGRPNDSASGSGPLYHENSITADTNSRPMYGLSQVFEVAASTNSPPTFSSTTAARSVDENTAAGQNVGAVLTATDSDGDTLTYTLEGTDAASFDLDTTTTVGSARIQTKTGVTYNHEAKSTYTVVVKADDGNGGTNTITVTITITDVTEAPGRPAAPTVIAVTGSTTSLAVSWTAPENTGRPPITGYSVRSRVGSSGPWISRGSNLDPTILGTTILNLSEATEYQVQVRATNDEGDSQWSQSGTGSTGTPTNAAPTFNDGTSTTQNFNESIGDATADTVIRSDIGSPVTATDTDTGDTLEYGLEGTDAGKFTIDTTSGQIMDKAGENYDYEAKASYSVTVTVVDGNGGSDTIAVTLEVLNRNEPPGRPAAPTVIAVTGSSTSLAVSWTAPPNTGRPVIDSYDLRYQKTTESGWTNGPQDRTGTGTSIGSLDAVTAYRVQVRATNDEGDSNWSSSGNATTGGAGYGEFRAGDLQRGRGRERYGEGPTQRRSRAQLHHPDRAGQPGRGRQLRLLHQCHRRRLQQREYGGDLRGQRDPGQHR